jgi:glycosyltransferase involved in cell wall biosynthesis
MKDNASNYLKLDGAGVLKLILPVKEYNSTNKLVTNLFSTKINFLRFNLLNITKIEKKIIAPDLFISHSLYHLFLVQRLSSHFKKNWIVYFHGRIGKEPGDVPLDFYMKHSLHNAAKIIVNRPSSYKTLSKIYGRKVVRIEPYVNTKKYPFKPKPITNKVNILYLGRMTKRRNPEIALKSLHYFKKKYGHSFTGHFVGGGPLLKDLIKLSKRLNLEKDVKFYGSINNVSPFLEKSHISLFTSSITNYPSRSLLECISSGVAVICTSSSESKYLVKHGHDGLLINPTDYKSISNSINKLVTDPILYNKLIKNARKRAEKLDITNFVDKYIKIIKESI